MKKSQNRISISKVARLSAVAAFSFFVAVSGTVAGEEYEQLVGGIHFDSSVSGGEYTIKQIAQIAEENDLDIAIVTDRDNATVEYGLFATSRFLKVSKSKPSIRSFGAKRYLELFDEARKAHPNLILIPGAEAMPFYYWEGSPLARTMSLRRAYEHLLLIGMDSPEDYDDIPSIAARYPSRASPYMLMILLPLAGLVAGFFLRARKKDEDVRTKQGLRKTLGTVLIIASLLALVDAAPFIRPEFDQYGGDRGVEPYQRLIDYAKERNALVFWAHPEVSEDPNEMHAPGKTILLHREAYPDDILKTQNHDGFAIFWEGMKTVGKPGGEWDQMLREYCQGKRLRRVWAIGELDFTESGESGAGIVRETLTAFWCKERSQKAVLEAIRNGRMYAARSYAMDDLSIEEFSITNERDETAISGETLMARGDVKITLTVQPKKSEVPLYSVQIIRDGEVVATLPLKNEEEELNGMESIRITYRDTPQAAKTFYRVILLKKAFPVVATNPIFVTR